MLSFKEFAHIDINPIIDEVLHNEWIVKSNHIWKCVDDSNNCVELHNDGDCWYVYENTFSPKVFAYLCNQFIREVKPNQLLFEKQVLYSA